MQAFFFNSLDEPPYFMYNIRPQHLAQIKRIEFVWHSNTIQSPCASVSRAMHRMRRCQTCNLSRWVRLINQYMTGLVDIEIFLVINDGKAPSLQDAWVQRLLVLKEGSNSNRKVTLRTESWGTGKMYAPQLQSLERFQSNLAMDLTERKVVQNVEV